MKPDKFRIATGSIKGQFFGTGIGSEKTGNSDFKADTDLECKRKGWSPGQTTITMHLQGFRMKGRSFRQHPADFSPFFGTLTQNERFGNRSGVFVKDKKTWMYVVIR